ncbi:hypothetical protein P1X15_11340 [Runella sp. MFBS21]|uniref:hypothetical protein n=1 Tax=Runella sp. MFBS21 TaxID=3034018 RepID=UPI0023F8B991|nr:hypothetical protein [Runella sp. MFBS21]MDF7818195.1 hypothetical protein [Runella sp. MFBS21]
MDKFCLICKLLCGLCLVSSMVCGQSLLRADSLLRENNYALAAVYYEKALFEQSTQPIVSVEAYRVLQNNLLHKKIQCQKSLRVFEEAWETAQRFDLNELNDTLTFKYRYETTLCGYLSGHYEEAYGQLQQTRYYVQDTTLTEGLKIIEIMLLNELGHWEESKAAFRKYAAQNQLFLDVDNLYREVKKKPKSADKAQLLSFIFPGLGQVYAGYPAKGIVSMGLQAFALSFGVYHVWHRYYFIGFFTGAGLFQSFYFGGARRAGIMAEETNRKRKARHNQKMRSLLVDTENKKRK